MQMKEPGRPEQCLREKLGGRQKGMGKNGYRNPILRVKEKLGWKNTKFVGTNIQQIQDRTSHQ